MKLLVITAVLFFSAASAGCSTFDAGKYVLLRLPSKGTLATDAFVGTVMVHDASKLVALAWKIWMSIPVDQRGRLYDVSDVSAQGVRSVSDMIGLGIVGEVFAQTFVEAGITWRSSGETNSFANHLLQNGLGSDFVNALRTTPVKIAVGYVMSEAINKIELDAFTRTIAKLVLLTTACKIATDMTRLAYSKWTIYTL